MITLESATHVDGLTGRQITGFMISCTDADYKAWWGEMHHRFHTVRVSLACADEGTGVRITHTIAAGWRGAGRVLDPLLRGVFVTHAFASDMDEHFRTEFRLLRDLLRRK